MKIERGLRNRRAMLAALAISVLIAASSILGNDPVPTRAGMIAGCCIILWLTEVIPPFVPTIILLVAIPVLLGSHEEEFSLPAVLSWTAHPVVALFAGGFALGIAAQKHGIDVHVASIALRLAGGSKRRLISLILGTTALLSMWMSNVAAAAMMLAAVRPIVRDSRVDDSFRRALLLALALGANFGGMSTPIGTGPNGIAIAAVSEQRVITFSHWMAFATPLAVTMLLLGLVMLFARFKMKGTFGYSLPSTSLTRPAGALVLLFSACVLAWLTEPIHGLPAAVVALAAAAVLFATRLLGGEDLRNLDWSTLGLIAGGIALGKLIEQSGLLESTAAALSLETFPHALWMGALVLATALLSAVMSNTAAAAMLIPLALSLDHSASTAVLIAIGASFGIPFTISTPPNAMVYGEGGVSTADLAWIGFPLMLLGCAVIVLTGAPLLELLGIE
jgi:sodium-dependent dicarboxylate transporter 2/3/5